MMHSNYRPRTLREAFDLTLEFKKEYQVTQPQSNFNVMETCCEDPEGEHEFSTEEVQMRSQAQNQSQYQQGNWPQNHKGQYQKQNNSQNLTREVNSRPATTKTTNLSTNRDLNLIKAADPSTIRDIKAKVRVKVKECNNPG